MIELKHVSRRFGTFKAVDDISFSIRTGEIVGLLGPNGAGKTTTMRMITGFLEPTEGVVLVDGLDVTQNPVQTKAKIGYMPESAPLYGDMIVADYLTYIADMCAVAPKERVPQVAAVCGLAQVMHKNISDLSRGNRQRVGLAHALMADPEILILDEPTSGLDPNQVSEVRDLIREMGKTRTVIISTHILSEVEMLCSRVIIISDGKKVADSPTEALRETYSSVPDSPGGTVSVIVGRADSAQEEARNALQKSVLEIDGVLSCAIEAEAPAIENVGEPLVQLSVGVKTGVEVRPELSRRILQEQYNLYSLYFQKNSLEDVFRALTKGGEEK